MADRGRLRARWRGTRITLVTDDQVCTVMLKVSCAGRAEAATSSDEFLGGRIGGAVEVLVKYSPEHLRCRICQRKQRRRRAELLRVNPAEDLPGAAALNSADDLRALG